MCLIAVALERHRRYRLVLVANRDEYRSRGSDPARFWDDAPHLLAGRDQQAGGTWMGLTTGGRLAAITNYRDTRQQVTDPPSRGSLVTAYLRDESLTPARFHGTLAATGNRYDGFNLLYGSVTELHYFTNRGGSSGPVPPGIHGLSNHLLDTAWPKVAAARERLAALLEQPDPAIADLLGCLADPTPFGDHLLPDTGIGPEWERRLSPLFIAGDHYGTRSTTLILADYDGGVTFVEQSHDLPGAPCRRFDLRIGGPERS